MDAIHGGEREREREREEGLHAYYVTFSNYCLEIGVVIIVLWSAQVVHTALSVNQGPQIIPAGMYWCM